MLGKENFTTNINEQGNNIENFGRGFLNRFRPKQNQPKAVAPAPKIVAPAPKIVAPAPKTIVQPPQVNLPPGVIVDKSISKLVETNKAMQIKTNPDKILNVLNADPNSTNASNIKKLNLLDDIYTITDDYQDTQVPISKKNMEKIANVALTNNLTLPVEILTILYQNRRNVAPIALYIQNRLANFFDTKRLLPPRNNKYFKIKLLNLCVKIKKDALIFNNDEILQTRQFFDMESLKVACQLYVWHIKINECAIINILPLAEYKTKWDKNVDRLCNIANVPLKKPSDFEKIKDDDGNDITPPSDELPLDEIPPDELPPELPLELPPSELPLEEPPLDLPPADLPPSESPPSESPPSGSSPSESPPSESPPSESSPSNSDEGKKSTENINENFTESIIEQLNYADYKYIIGIIIFILFLIIIYIRYKN
jgi:hypothetical protein